MQKDASQIQLDLETDIHVGAVYRGRPPECEPTVGNLVETGALCVSKFLEFHALFEAARAFPEQTL